MKSFLVILVFIFMGFESGKCSTLRPQQTDSVQYFTKQNQSINIHVMFHIDQILAVKLAKHYGTKTRKKLKEISRNILRDVGRIYQHQSLNQTIRFILIDTRFIRNNDHVITMDENATKYLKSYCDWQSRKKMTTKRWYYSVLLTGLDLFFVNSRGEEVRSSTGRSYLSSMCSMKKSCTLIEWHPKNIGFLLAHEIAHGLGVNHDGAPFNHCRSNHVMSGKYHVRNHPKTWSECSRQALKGYLQSDRMWCIKPEVNTS